MSEWTDAYLARIGLPTRPSVDLTGLELLQRAHMTHVPFENLDVYHRRGVSTDPRTAITKIVDRRRGGWCFELNGAFGSLLRTLGFVVTRLGASVILEPDPPVGPQPSHAAVRVDLDHPYLVDVGFGDSFFRPLALDTEEPQDGGKTRYRFHRPGGTITLEEETDDGWQPQYRFIDSPVEPEVFNPSNRFLQSSPTTHFTQKPFATRLIDGGPDRVTLVHDRLKQRVDGVWTEQPVDTDEWSTVLYEEFRIEP